ncbi:MAG: hypothetical protein IPO70_11135 [Bacteroidetes bacterium]|nr:hypothetical protein [Bacteroidota bacterium]
MLNEFTPLRDCIKYWPGFLGEAGFIDSIGLKSFDSQITDQSYNISGEAAILETIEFPFLLIPDSKLSILKENDYTVIPFEASITPNFKLALTDIKISLSLDYDFLIPVEFVNNMWTKKNTPFALSLSGYDISFDLDKGLEFIAATPVVTVDAIQLGDTGIIVQLTDVVPLLSGNENSGLPIDLPLNFRGVYIETANIILPDFFGSDTGSTTTIVGKDLLIGTGGFSGTIGFASNSGFFKVKIGSYEVKLTSFNLTFHQNSITGSEIKGELKVPGFKDGATNGDLLVEADILIGEGGKFEVSVSTHKPIPVFKLAPVLAIDVRELSIGRQSTEAGGNFYVGISGDIDILLQAPLGKFLPDKIDIKKLLIYEDGNFEIEGGSIVLPKAFEIKLGPAKIGITAIHLGSYEKDGRKYKYFGFDGGVNVNPGGVDARGKGITYYYSVDGQDFDWFIRLESLAIDIIIPGDGDKDDAAVIIEGFLSIKDPVIPTGTTEPLLSVLKNSTEYAGGVHLAFPKMKGLEASASMRMNPQVPSFIIDLGLELSTPILLGSTGLGIYGFRGLFGKKYVATKEAAGIPEDGEWWQYYKAKIDPDYLEGIQVSKFSIKNGFSFGAGISLATSSDSGKTFSSKLFVMLCLPDVLFMFQGQAAILKDRIGLNANPDPPFFALIVISKHSVEAGFGVNYKIPEDTGKVIAVEGIIEMGFFWGSSSAWYVNIGRDQPEDRRITARVFDLFDMYTYFMISNNGIRAGAGIDLEFNKSFGPLKAELSAYFDVSGRISFRPKQIGGAIQLKGTASLTVCGVGVSVSANATLAAEASHPKIVTGTVEACAKILKKQRCAHFEFTWQDATDIPLLENPILIDPEDNKAVASASNIVTGETFPVLCLEGSVLDANLNSLLPGLEIPTRTTPQSLDECPYIIPMDSYINIEFKKGMNVSKTTVMNKIGGLSSPCEYIEYVPPIRGASPRVCHEYSLEEIQVLYYDENGTSPKWKEYDFYQAMLPLFSNNQLSPAIDTAVLENMKYGYWMQQRPGFNNKLQILAKSPLNYLATTGNNITVEDLGINANTILCPGPAKPFTCITFEDQANNKTFLQNKLHHYKNILFKITSKEGVVLNLPYQNIQSGLCIQPGDKIELYFKEPMKSVKLLLNTGAPTVTISSFKRKQKALILHHLPLFEYELNQTQVFGAIELGSQITLTNSEDNIDYVLIETSTCYESEESPKEITCLQLNERQQETLELLNSFLSTLFEDEDFPNNTINIHPEKSDTYKPVFMDTMLYPNRDWDIDKDLEIRLTEGYCSYKTLLFTVSDNRGYNCNFSFEVINGPFDFSFDQISAIQSIQPMTEGAQAGFCTSFLMNVIYLKDGTEPIEVVIIGKSCNALTYCYDNCSTFLYKLCYQSVEDYLVNLSIPTATDQQTNNNLMFNSINKTLQPIWRPNTAFAIRIKTRDKVYVETDSQSANEYYTDKVFAFRTVGPIGHFHNYPVTTQLQQKRASYIQLEEKAHQAEFKLSSLKNYIDYSKSYPNADGDIINAKPIFYKNIQLKLFYLYNFVYEFYSNWVDQSNQSGFVAKSKLDIVIKDPRDPNISDASIVYDSVTVNNPAAAFSANNIPHTPVQTGSLNTNINSLNNDISILNNILHNISANDLPSPCIPPGASQQLAPIDIASTRTVSLYPSKMYTAQFEASYAANIADTLSDNFKEVVHSYVFQTSQYPDFSAQIKSYILKSHFVDEQGNTVAKTAVPPLGQSFREVIDKAAIYDVPAEMIGSPTPTIDLSLAHRVITNTLLGSDEPLKVQFADQFDRLINGVLHIDYNKLQTPVTTEFNIIKHPVTGNILGILIQNPEPFNNPKMPKADPNISSIEPMETLEVRKLHGIEEAGAVILRINLPEQFEPDSILNWGNPSEFYVIHSKDRSRMFVTNRNFNFNISNSSILKLTFKYKLYNGLSYYDNEPTVNILIKLNNYLF